MQAYFILSIVAGCHPSSRAVEFPHLFDQLALGDSKFFRFGRNSLPYFGKNLRVQLVGARTGFAARLLARGAIKEPPSLSNVIHTPDFFGACLFRACRKARKPI
jgi:hypothetical protein|tara:strand:+ start:3212 stop:3523 length:312 start_codon:yes stop_codon:yes gene_type:complete